MSREYIFSRTETLAPKIHSEGFTSEVRYQCEVIPAVEGLEDFGDGPFRGHPYTDDNFNRLVNAIFTKEYQKGDRITTIDKTDISDFFDLVKITTPLTPSEMSIIAVRMLNELRIRK